MKKNSNLTRAVAECQPSTERRWHAASAAIKSRKNRQYKRHFEEFNPLYNEGDY